MAKDGLAVNGVNNHYRERGGRGGGREGLYLQSPEQGGKQNTNSFQIFFDKHSQSFTGILL